MQEFSEYAKGKSEESTDENSDEFQLGSGESDTGSGSEQSPRRK